MSRDNEWLTWVANAIERRIGEIEATGRRTKKGKLRTHEERKILALRAYLARYRKTYAGEQNGGRA